MMITRNEDIVKKNGMKIAEFCKYDPFLLLSMSL